MKTRPLALGLFALGASLLSASDFALPVVRDSLDELQAMRDAGELVLQGGPAQQRFARVLQQLSRLAQELGGGGGGPVVNVRKQAAAFLVATVDGGKGHEASRKLPEFVTEDDFAFLQRVASKQPGPWVPLIVESYFSGAPEPTPGNFRGRAAGGMSQAMEAEHLYKALKKLPEFCGPDDASFLAWLGSTAAGPWLPLQLESYAARPSRRDARNRKGSAARILCQGLDDEQRYKVLKVIPDFVAEADLPLLQTLAEKESGAMLVYRAEQYFKSRGA
jgi:hypothetical protein